MSHIGNENVSTCENIDNMLLRFKKDRDYILNLILDNVNKLIIDLWTPASPICFDDKCLFNMGRTQQIYTLEERIEGKNIINETVLNYYSCPQCRNIRRLVDLDQNKIGEPFTIECGNLMGEQMVITETPIEKLFILNESIPLTVQKVMKSPYFMKLQHCSNSCSSNVCEIKKIKNYIGLDPFSNNMLINFFLNKELSKLGIKNVIEMYTSYVCSGKGYSVYEFPNIGRIRHFQEHSELLEQSGKPSPTAKADDKTLISAQTVRSIIMQLFSVLHVLRKFDFSHGGPSSRSLLFSKKEYKNMYDGVIIECPITLKLCDLYHAGITIGHNRLYNKSVIADEEILRKPFKPIIDAVSITPFSFDRNSNKEKITIYRLKDPQKYFQEAMLFMYIKHLGLPIYQASFDAYGFMISLMADRAFYTSVMNDELSYLLWRSMWLPEEFEKIQDKILKLHDSHDPITRVDKTLLMLAGFGLRCDMIDYGWNQIKKW